jgi:Ser/Thr protein kinase RdoA (MazF antagonist)
MLLFQPDDLSIHKPEFIELDDSRLSEEIYQLLHTYYTFLDISEVQIECSIGANITSQNYRVNLPNENYFLKFRGEADNKDMLEKEAELGEQLAEAGVKVPRGIKSDLGEYVTILNHQCWMLYEFQEGDRFSGKGKELDSAAKIYGELSKAASELTDASSWFPDVVQSAFMEVLENVLEEIAANRAISTELKALCATHSTVIIRNLSEIRTHRALIEAASMVMHLDYHPLNLLMQNEEVACVLDFEDIQMYFLLAGLGFSGYKLIRQMMVDPDTRRQELPSRPSVRRWIEGWQTYFPETRFTSQELGWGARYRVLYIIHMILDKYQEQGLDVFIYDLEKQIRSLYEIDIIFGPNLSGCSDISIEP